jgi:hypothetical protein
VTVATGETWPCELVAFKVKLSVPTKWALASYAQCDGYAEIPPWSGRDTSESVKLSCGSWSAQRSAKSGRGTLWPEWTVRLRSEQTGVM